MKKFFITLVFLFLFCFPVNAEDIITGSEYRINPLYEHLNIQPKELYNAADEENADNICENYDEAVEYLTEQCKIRKPVINMIYYADKSLIKDSEEKTKQAVFAELASIFDAIGDYSEFEQNGDISDYIFFQHAGIKIEYSFSNNYNAPNFPIRVTYTIYWFVNPAQQAIENAKVQEILDTLDVYDKDEYTQVKTVYDYILDNAEYVDSQKYDEAATRGEHTVYHSSYSALVMGETVCQGYATAVYRLLRELGISCRVVSGYAGGPHAWNMVRIGSYYYLIDATWDDTPYGRYDYFLKADYDNHTPDLEFISTEFKRFFPMAEEDYTEPLEYIPNPPSNITLTKNGDNLVLTFDLDYTAQCACVEKGDEKNGYTEVYVMGNSIDDLTTHTFTDEDLKNGTNNYRISALRAEVNSRTGVQTQHSNVVDKAYFNGLTISNDFLSVLLEKVADAVTPTFNLKLHLSDVKENEKIFVFGLRNGVAEKPHCYTAQEDMDISYENFDENCTLKILCIESLATMKPACHFLTSTR